MKKILLPLLLVLVASCASQKSEQKVADQPTEQERNVASYEAQCKIVKHPTQDLYNLSMYGHTYNSYWYDELEMELLYQRFVSQGRCDQFYWYQFVPKFYLKNVRLFSFQLDTPLAILDHIDLLSTHSL